MRFFLNLARPLFLILFLSGCTTVSPEALSLSWPLSIPKLEISRRFSTHQSPHHGIDLPGRMGEQVLSAHQGYVIYAGNGYKGYGNLVIVDSGQGWSTFYAHLNRVFVKEAVFIQKGEVIGTVGMTGKTTGPHLHFELRRHKIPVDPEKYLP